MKIGLLCSSFDLLHAGHITAIEQAKSQCDKLILALNVHPEHALNKHKPVQSVYERWKQISALRDVHQIIPYEDDNDLILLLETTNYDIRFLGSDYINKKHIGYEYEMTHNKQIVYLPRDHALSTSELRLRIKRQQDAE